MKKYVFLLMSAFCSFANAQDNSGIELSAYTFPDENMSENNHRVLGNKLHQIITQNGISASGDSRFIITANVVRTSTEVAETVPPKVLVNFDITLYIGDGITGQAFSSYNVKTKAIGNNMEKAYAYAFRSIDENNPKFQEFLKKGKEKIVNHYTQSCGKILSEAQSYAKQNSYDEALYTLSLIPSEAGSCYAQASSAMQKIYVQKINGECEELVKQAELVWSQSPDASGASMAAQYLSQIDVNAKCYPKAKALTDKIQKRIKEIDQREWNFIVESERDKMRTIRKLAEEYAKSTPKHITYKTFW